MASSALDARMFVCFFSFVTLTSMSVGARVLADDHAFVDRRARVDEDLAALLQVEDRVGRWPRRRGRRRARRSRARGIAPCHGSQLAKMWFMMPVPFVSVMNCDRKPMSPRAGIRNSSRTRPLPLFTIFVIVPLPLADLRDDDALVTPPARR